MTAMKSLGAARFCLGQAELAQRRPLSAVENFNYAERQGFPLEQCAGSRWNCWMLLGKFEDAWRESDRIAALCAPGPAELWDGLPLAGKRVVIRCLHGFGDTIQFLRYTELVKQTAAEVIVETHPEMVSLAHCLSFIDRVVTWSDAGALSRDDWDQQIELTELPRIFRTTVSTIPCRIPYFHISKEAIERSRVRLLSERDGPKVGLLWAASSWNTARSVPLRSLAPLLDDRRFSFYSFQRGAAFDEVKELGPGKILHDTSAGAPDIADTAADLTHMDLLITVDTMAAHLAGALGRPVFTLLPFEADWRWMMDRTDTPWYPTMQLFRQGQKGDWSGAIGDIAEALSQFA